jgi:hypothetical protein
MEEEFLISEHTCSPRNYGLSFSEESPVEYLFFNLGSDKAAFSAACNPYIYRNSGSFAL